MAAIYIDRVISLPGPKMIKAKKSTNNPNVYSGAITSAMVMCVYPCCVMAAYTLGPCHRLY